MKLGTGNFIPGLKLEKIQQDHAVYDHVFAGEEAVGTAIDWEQYLPEGERQWLLPFCVSFSRLNCYETMARFHGKEINLSDRHLAVAVGTTRDGAYMSIAADYLKNKGVVREDICPLPAEWAEEGIGAWEKIFELPPQTETETRYFGGAWSWVVGGRDVMRQALRYSPLQIGFPIGETYYDAYVRPPQNVGAYHAVTLYKIDQYGVYYVFDSLINFHKKLAPDYPITSCMSFRDLPDGWQEKQKKRLGNK